MSIDTTSTPAADPFEDDFADPKTGFDDIREYAGQLVIVKTLKHTTGLTTKHSKIPGDASAVDFDFSVVTGPDAGKEFTSARTYSGGLVSQFSRAIGGKRVLGRIGKQKFDKGEGWVFLPASDEDKALARTFVAAQRERQAAAAAAADPFA